MDPLRTSARAMTHNSFTALLWAKRGGLLLGTRAECSSSTPPGPGPRGLLRPPLCSPAGANDHFGARRGEGQVHLAKLMASRPALVGTPTFVANRGLGHHRTRPRGDRVRGAPPRMHDHWPTGLPLAGFCGLLFQVALT